MRELVITLIVAVAVMIIGCAETQKANMIKHSQFTPPVASVSPTTFSQHGVIRVDDYYWLNQRENPETIAYLNAENDYTNSVMGPHKEFSEELFNEIKGRIKDDDSTAPYKNRDYYYYKRYEKGKQYPLHCRKKGSLDAEEEILLNLNEMAQGHGYFEIGSCDISEDQNLIAYTVDTTGRRLYTLRVKDLTTGKTFEDAIPNVEDDIHFANDNKTLFYVVKDEETLRPYLVYRHILGDDKSEDTLIYEEKDEIFEMGIEKTKSRKFILLVSYHRTSMEFRYLDADDPLSAPKIFLPKQENHEYWVDHMGDRFFIRTNHQATNFRVMTTSVNDTAVESWTELLPNRDDVFVTDLEVFEDFLVVSERKDGLVNIRVKPWEGDGEHLLEFDDPTYEAQVDNNWEMGSQILRFEYSCLTTPDTIYDYDMKARTREVVKRDEVLGSFDSSDYVSERIHARAKDGTLVPISLFYKKSLKKDGRNPLLLYGYGSYGSSVDAAFSSIRLSLVDRGFVYARAHIRGGSEMGQKWYDDGKLKNKMNTFTDFIACGEHLVENGYASKDKLFAYGGSAGGLLIGAVVNLRPDLFHGVVAAVPFVDVVTTMFDDTIPLTTYEYNEWGNPNNKEYFDYMLAYSPYDNVEAKDYPNILVETGLNDSQVQYFEPAKWVAKLRAMKTDDKLLLMKTEMESGHGGPSGRYNNYREAAFEWTFLLVLAGIYE